MVGLCKHKAHLRGANIWVVVVVILPLLCFPGQQHLVVTCVERHTCIWLVPARPHALLHMLSVNARLACTSQAA